VTGQQQDVLEAAASLVAAFGAHDTEAYFGSFAAGATFLFHTAEHRLGARAEYERLWASWEAETGFRVLSCTSTDQHVQLLDEDAGIAVFTHRVRTVVRSSDGEEALDERETIVFQRDADGRWLAVHEHLSPSPGQPS
jgi:ketosteroid isomerase-like protein